MNQMDCMDETETKVALPRFKFEQTMDLKAQLRQLGIEKLFSKEEADLSGRIPVIINFINLIVAYSVIL